MIFDNLPLNWTILNWEQAPDVAIVWSNDIEASYGKDWPEAVEWCRDQIFPAKPPFRA